LGKAIFGYDFNSLEDPTQKDAVAYYTILTNGLNPFYIFFSFLTKLGFLEYNKVTSKAVNDIHDLYHRLINTSKQKISEKKVPTTLLDFMVKSHLTESGMDYIELRDNIANFLLAGHETTAQSLSFLIYSLAEHQDVQEKARKEILDVIGNNPLTYENVQKLDYLAMVIKEQMRMYPPISISAGRITAEPVVIGGYKIPKGVCYNCCI
jgi:cytochrome P450